MRLIFIGLVIFFLVPSCSEQDKVDQHTSEDKTSEKKIKKIYNNYYQVKDNDSTFEKGLLERSVLDSFNTESQLIKKTVCWEEGSHDPFVSYEGSPRKEYVIFTYDNKNRLSKTVTIIMDNEVLDSTVYTYETIDGSDSLLQNFCRYERDHIYFPTCGVQTFKVTTNDMLLSSLGPGSRDSIRVERLTEDFPAVLSLTNEKYIVERIIEYY